MKKRKSWFCERYSRALGPGGASLFTASASGLPLTGPCSVLPDGHRCAHGNLIRSQESSPIQPRRLLLYRDGSTPSIGLSRGPAGRGRAMERRHDGAARRWNSPAMASIGVSRPASFDDGINRGLDLRGVHRLPVFTPGRATSRSATALSRDGPGAAWRSFRLDIHRPPKQTVLA